MHNNAKKVYKQTGNDGVINERISAGFVRVFTIIYVIYDKR